MSLQQFYMFLWKTPKQISARIPVYVPKRNKLQTSLQHIDAQTLAAELKADADVIKASKLEAIDRLLWGLPAEKNDRPTSSQGNSCDTD